MKLLERTDINHLRDKGYKSIVHCCRCSDGKNPLIFGRLELHPFKTEIEAGQFLRTLSAPADPHDAPFILDIDDSELEEMLHVNGTGIEFFIQMSHVR